MWRRAMRNSLPVYGEESSCFLTEFGLTKTQVSVYFTLLKLGEADAKALSRKGNIPRPMVYKTLEELQEAGVVEKEIAAPFRFRAIPLRFGLQVLLVRRLQQHKELQEKTKEFLRNINEYEEGTLKEEDYKFVIIQSRERIIQRMKLQHVNTQCSADIISTWHRLLQIMDYCYEYYEQALERGVKYRVILEKPRKRLCIPENLRDLAAKPNFRLRFTRKPIKTNAGIFDMNEATFNFYPSKSLKESPVIWTNHPTFLAMYEDHFDKIWKSAVHFEG
jgi:sugar-specific transcriptional regulator TrmB